MSLYTFTLIRQLPEEFAPAAFVGTDYKVEVAQDIRWLRQHADELAARIDEREAHLVGKTVAMYLRERGESLC